MRRPEQVVVKRVKKQQSTLNCNILHKQRSIPAPAGTGQTTEAHFFRPSWQDISKQKLGITHSTVTCYTNKGAFQPQQKLDKPLKHIIFRPSWQDTSRLQTSITHSTATCYISRRTFQPLPRPPFGSTSWHYRNAVNVYLPSIYQTYTLSRGSKVRNHWQCVKT